MDICCRFQMGIVIECWWSEALHVDCNVNLLISAFLQGENAIVIGKTSQIFRKIFRNFIVFLIICFGNYLVNFFRVFDKTFYKIINDLGSFPSNSVFQQLKVCIKSLYRMLRLWKKYWIKYITLILLYISHILTFIQYIYISYIQA